MGRTDKYGPTPDLFAQMLRELEFTLRPALVSRPGVTQEQAGDFAVQSFHGCLF